MPLTVYFGHICYMTVNFDTVKFVFKKTDKKESGSNYTTDKIKNTPG